MTFLAMAYRSESETTFPVSPSFFTSAATAFSCSLVGLRPMSSSMLEIPCLPACFPATIRLSFPTNSGRSIS